MSETVIESVSALQIFDSRGKPTVEAEVTLTNGARGRGVVPSGASTGQYEALELRDGDAEKFRGLGVSRAVANVEGEIADAVRGMRAESVNDVAVIDRAMIALDGTHNKARLGANAVLAVSMAVANAAASAASKPLYAWLGEALSQDRSAAGTLLPLPEIQIVGGGAHAAGRTDVQDFMVMAVGATTYSQTLEMTFHVYQAAADMLRSQGKLRGVADEGGFWPEFDGHEAIFEFLLEAIERAGYVPGKEVALSLDIAASDLYDETTQRYTFKSEGRTFTSAEFAALMAEWCARYPVVAIEDPMADVDTAGWKAFRALTPRSLQVIGDDLFTTNVARIEAGARDGLANAVLIKLNQIGTVTETLEAIALTQELGWLPVVSARSGETEDAFIAHLAVGTNAGQLKVGSFTRSERMAKWNEVLRIERELGAKAMFEGAKIFERLR